TSHAPLAADLGTGPPQLRDRHWEHTAELRKRTRSGVDLALVARANHQERIDSSGTGAYRSQIGFAVNIPLLRHGFKGGPGREEAAFELLVKGREAALVGTLNSAVRSAVG